MKKYGVAAALALAVIIAGVIIAARFSGGAMFVGVAVALLGVIAAIWCVLKLTRRPELTSAKYVRKKSLLTACEIEFLQVLRRIEPDRYEVVPQPALVSVIDKRTETSYRNELFRIIDYAFVDRRTFAPLLLVELNDRSHLRADRKLRDEKVAEICRKAKMPLVTFTTDEAKDFSLVRKRVLSEILKR